jgi:hypothetical protein
MIRLILITILFATYSLSAASQGVFKWAEDIGTSSFEMPNKICADGEGNSYVAGFYLQSLIICEATLDTVIQPQGSNQTSNIFISKFDSLGNCLWTKTGISIVPMVNGGAMGPTINDIKYYDGTIYCVGVFTNKMVFDADTLSNNTCQSYCTTSYILSLDASTGVNNWYQCFDGTTTYSSVYSVIPYSDGLFVSGTYVSALSADTVQLNSLNSWNYTAYLLKFNHSGTCEWGKNIGINRASAVVDMTFDEDQNLYLVGTYADSIIFPTITLHDILPVYERATFFAKYDTAGNFIWAKGGMADLRGIIWNSRLSYGPDGYLYYTGSFKDSVRFGSTSFVTSSSVYSDVIVKLDQSGQFLWVKNIGNRPGYQNYASSIATNNNGFMLFSSFDNSVVLENDTLQTNGMLDNLLIQFDFDGNIIYDKHFGGLNPETTIDVFCHGADTYLAATNASNYVVDNINISNVSGGDIFIARMYDSTISTAAVKDQMKEVNFQVFPNPSTGSINVRCEHPVKEIKITNTWGQTVFAESPNSNTVHFELQISGVYFVTISDGKSVMTKKCSVLK